MMSRKTFAAVQHHQLRPVALAIFMAAGSGGTLAADIDTGVTDLSLRWDNTFKYSAARRLSDADPALAGDPNQGDGDTNFRKAGLVSSRLDWLSEMEAKYKGFGLRVSGAAWRDGAYLRSNRNDTAGAFGPGTSAVNSSEIAAPTQFTPYVRKTHGRNGEILDAFVSAGFELGGKTGTVRLGQHTLQWGESLFFGDNGIAGAMSAIDVVKAVSVPNVRFQEILRPAPQLSGQLQLTDELTAMAFYQFRFKENRLPGAGSYFSPVDFGVGGNLLLTPTGPLVRTAERGQKEGGQGGVALRWRDDNADYGVYAVRFHSKNPVTIISGSTGSYYDQWHTGINAVGASFSRSLGDFNIGAEASVRNNQDLLAPNAYDAGAGARYAVGRTAHVNVSVFAPSIGRSAAWDDALLLGEIAFTRVLSVTRDADTLSGCTPAFFPGTVCQPNGSRDVVRLQVLFEPVYYQVVSGLDLRVPVGLSFTPKGSRNQAGAVAGVENGGALNIGITATWLDSWRIGLNATHYFGKTNTLFSPVGPATQAWNYGQPMRDRDHISLVVNRTF
ncbi:MAG: DUF1302 domain-containing protein [Sphaerotilus natans subsp. sulfidivorans]|uniref:DUF1302 domain-containing protein n=1 Tax=Sphaerotilus sulfidivorans TaxID=639200 RepID=UPI0023570127|nr:DUF1302 family protein [Sphaerotilus sulfidivorans]MCK6401315.1 DUF1302 domain-containing protein [Sphaerotilus sulfidivorans]